MLVVSLLSLVLTQGATDHVCVNSFDVVGLDARQKGALEAGLKKALEAQGLSVSYRAHGDPQDNSCEEGALGVLHIAVVRVGPSLHAELSTFDPRVATGASITKIEVERPQRSTVVDLEPEIKRLIAALRGTLPSVAPTPPPPPPPEPAAPIAPAPVVTQGTPAPSNVGWVPIGLWVAGGAALVTASVFELDALSHKHAVDEGRAGSEVDNRDGIRSQNIARITAGGGIALIALGLAWWHFDVAENVALIPAPGGASVLARF